MSSRTRIQKLARDLRWQELETDLRKDPGLLGLRDEKGRNLLHLCCGVNPGRRGLRPGDSIRTADVLLDAGIDIDEAAFVEGDWKATPLWYAVAFGDNLALVKHLLERGSSPRYCLWAAVNRDDAAAIRLLVQHGADDPTNEKDSPLLAAVDWNKPAAAAALLELGAIVDYQSEDGRTPLHTALRKRRDSSFVQLLVDHGARGDIEDGSGETATDLLKRRRDPVMRALADRLAAGAAPRTFRAREAS